MMRIPSLKAKTKLLPITKLKDPEVFYMPLSGYKGALTPTVKLGDSVKQDQVIARPAGVQGAILHAPVSGTVGAVIQSENKSYLKLINDFRYEKEARDALVVNERSPSEIIDLIRLAGIEGSGGARFPTHLKYKKTTKLTTWIINGAECEPYLSADYALMSHYGEQLMKAISVMQDILDVSEVVFGIEKQHKELKAKLIACGQQFGLPLKVHLLPNEYPQGGELQLIKSVTGKELQKGEVPAEHGVIVNNVGTLWALYGAFYENQPYTARVVTISGEHVSHVGNYLVKIGTPITTLLQQIGHRVNFSEETVIAGGPMMGKAVHDAAASINKGTGGILVIPQPKNNRFNCIQCGYCADVCPQHLMPMEFARYMAHPSKSKLREFHLNDCIECGACAYACPSDVPLMKSIFDGKELLRS